ncbi:hypothetical protein ABPG72_005402 [Tetrahymena utriculariae]
MNSVRDSESSFELQNNQVCFKLYLNCVMEKNCSNSNSERKQSFFIFQKENDYLVEIEKKFNYPQAFSKNQRDQQNYDNDFIYIQELEYYNQISDDLNQFKEESLKNFYHKKLQLTFKTDCDRDRFNENDLCISGALASLFILHLRFQIISEAKPFFQDLNFQKQNLISKNSVQLLASLLFNQKSMQNIWFNQLLKLFSSQKSYLEVLSFFTQNFKTIDQEQKMNEGDMNSILEYFSESLKVYITVFNEIGEQSGLFYPNQKQKEGDSKYQEEKDEVIPFIIIKQFKDGVDVYFSQPLFNVIIEQSNNQQIKPLPINYLQSQQLYYLVENTNYLKQYQEYVKTKNPLECIVSITYVNLLQQIIYLKNNSKPEAEKYSTLVKELFDKFKQPFQKEKDDANSSSLSSNQNLSDFCKNLNKFEKIIQTNQKLDNNCIKLLYDIIKTFEQSQELNKKAYEFVLNQINQKRDICLSSKEINKKFQDEYYNEVLLPQEQFPSYVLNQQECIILIPKKQENQVKSQNNYSFFKKFCMCFRQENNERQSLIQSSQQNDIQGDKPNYTNPFFIIIFDQKKYLDQMQQQNRLAKESISQRNSKRGNSNYAESFCENEYDNSGTLICQTPQTQQNQLVRQQNTQSNNEVQQNMPQPIIQQHSKEENILNSQEKLKQNIQQQSSEQNHLLFQQNQLQQKDQSSIQQQETVNEQQAALEKQQQQQKYMEEMQKENKEFEASLLQCQNKLLMANQNNLCTCGKIQEVFYENFKQCQNCLIKKFYNYC